MSEGELRVLQGVTGQAGQPHALASGLRKIGIAASSCAVAKNRYGYPADIAVELSRPRNLERSLAELWPTLEPFDVVHFHARSFLTKWPHLGHPSLLDILALKMSGKRVFFHFRGQEARLAGQFRSVNPYHYVDDADCADLFKVMPDAVKRRAVDFLRGVCDGLFVVDPELQTYVPDAHLVPRALEAEAWPFVGVSDTRRPVVVHAPSRRGIKGTDTVLRSVRALEESGLKFEFKLIEKRTHAEAAALYRQADIVVDQLRIGWYGVLATEALALGKPTIAYIRDDLWAQHGHALPIVNANVETFTEKLRALLLDADRRKSLAARSRDYFLKTHAATKIAHDLARIYRQAASDDKPVDWLAVGRFLDYQAAVAAGMAKAKGNTAPRAVFGHKNLFSPPLRKIPFRMLKRIRIALQREDGGDGE